jgi:hypothetical protein
MNSSESLSTSCTDGDRSHNSHSVLSRRIARTPVFLVHKAHPVRTRPSRAADSITTPFVSDSSDIPFITPGIILRSCFFGSLCRRLDSGRFTGPRKSSVSPLTRLDRYKTVATLLKSLFRAVSERTSSQIPHSSKTLGVAAYSNTAWWVQMLKWWTESPGVRYLQKQDKIGFFSNVMPVLPPSGLWRCWGPQIEKVKACL